MSEEKKPVVEPTVECVVSADRLNDLTISGWEVVDRLDHDGRRLR